MSQPKQPVTSDGTTVYNAPNVSSGQAGLVPATGGGSTNFLRADGTFTSPGGGGVSSIGINNNSPVSSGTVALAIPSQPLVPASGIIQPLPPGNTYASGNPLQFFLRTSSSFAGICVGSDGNLWATDRHSPRKLWQITPSGSITSFSILFGPWELCTGPDGNLWIVDGSNGGVQVYSTSGSSIASYTLTGSNPVDICAGSDGNLWVTDSVNAQVWKITTSGVATAIPLPVITTNSVCAGPDGNIWLAKGSNIYKVTTSGSVTTYNITGSSNLNYICSGSDGNLWLTASGSKLWKISTSGSFTSYSISGLAGYICSGPDGNLWASSSSGTVWRMSLSGTLLNTFTLSGTGTPNIQQLCPGPDGGMWLADFNTANGSIWQIPIMQTAGPRNCVSPITTVSGSTAGTMYWSQPEQGPGYKTVVVVLSGFNDSGKTITFPTPFTQTPSYNVGAGNVPVTPTSVSTTQLVLPSTGGAVTGTILVEGI